MNSYYVERHEKYLRALLDKTEIPAQKIKDAMYYALFSGGKRLRPVLVYLSGEIMQAPIESLDVIAAAVELIHCYSLIHDDLPAMDNDDFRRGKPSCHKAFDEGTAILTGDGLQALSIDWLLTELSGVMPAPKVLQIAHALVKACGPSGMVSGQSLDLSELVNPSITEQQLTQIHELKTGQLIMACSNMAIQAGADITSSAQALINFSRHFGLAFQMQDDYLDLFAVDLGKGRHSDHENNKITFTNLYPQDELRELISNHFQQAKDALIPIGPGGFALLEFVDKYCDN